MKKPDKKETSEIEVFFNGVDSSAFIRLNLPECSFHTLVQLTRHF